MGHILDGYRIVAVLGRGGFAITYLAVEESLGRHVAVKEYLPREIAWRANDGISVLAREDDRAADYSLCLDCFRREANALIQFRHPNIVTVLRYFEANGTAYMVMDYEPGASLARVLTEIDRIDETWLRSILDPLLDGLETIHAKDLFHRDIKPSNIYIRADGSPVLLDFGSARKELANKTPDLSIVLTPGFAPIEQYGAGIPQGPWTDIYSLGMTLYVVVTGQMPPVADERAKALEEHGVDPLVPASAFSRTGISRPFLATIDSAIALHAGDRPQNIAAWRRNIGCRPTAQQIVAAAIRMGAAGLGLIGPPTLFRTVHSVLSTRRNRDGLIG